MAKILIVRLGAMGDILHALPAASAIRASLPDATIGWLVEEKWSELLTSRSHKAETLGPERPLVNYIHTVDTLRWRRRFWKTATWSEMRGAIGRMRSLHYEVALDFQGAIKSGVFAVLSGANERAGFARPRESAARVFYSRTFPFRGTHKIELDHALAGDALAGTLAGHNFELTAPKLPVDPEAEAWAEGEIRRLGIASFAIMTPGAGWGAKQWPAERYGQVAKALAAHNIKTLINVAPGEEELAVSLLRASDGHAFPVRSTVGQLISLTRRARIVLGGDTGPMHLAAALQVPVVALFGPTDPARTGPFGTQAITLRSPESRTTDSHHRAPEEGLLKITVDEVVAAARSLLAGAHG